MSTTRFPVVAAVLASSLLLAMTFPAAAYTVAPGDRPNSDVSWGPFAIDESQVRNNDLPGGPSDGSTDSPATGSATFAYDRESDRLNYTVSWQNLTSPLLDIRVHGPATATQTSDDRLFDVLGDELAVVSSGVGRISGSYSGTLDLQNPPDVSCGCDEFHPEEAAKKIMAALLEGHAYINLRTQAFLTGEIRGNFPAATASGEPGPTPNPVPLPPGAWSAIGTFAVLGTLHAFRTRRNRNERAE